MAINCDQSQSRILQHKHIITACTKMEFSQQVRQELVKTLTTSAGGSTEELNSALRLLSKWRSVLIQNTYLQKEGTSVYSGPLKGLSYLEQSSEGCHVAKLLGCYEQPIHSHLEQLAQINYEKILNIGCAEGYYAVGLARLFPSASCMAFDINPTARKACESLAIKNKVKNRLEVNKKFSSSGFYQFKNKRTLVFCDIEGAELELFNQQITPALVDMDLIIESHECIKPGITECLVSRFSSTHDIAIVRDSGSRNLAKMPHWFENLSHLDQLLAVWEWRSGPTPWLIMRAKS